jgi:hypothetical protein
VTRSAGERCLAGLAVVLLAATSLEVASARAFAGVGVAASPICLERGAPDAWLRSGLLGIRGVTIGPIENGYHPGRGYGSPAYDRMLVETRAMGGSWVAITPFGRVADLAGNGVDPTFEAPFEANRSAVKRAIAMAHGRGLRVLLVPHLWVETGDWRAKIDPKTDDGWARWAKSYEAFIVAWARVAEENGAEMFSAGVELRSWVTTPRAPSFASILKAIRRAYRGLVTYSGNWDDIEETAILGDLDIIGINAFYPLADKDGADEAELRKGGERVRARVHALAEAWRRPVLFTEFGYTTRRDPAIRPWEWPEAMKNVVVDEDAQAVAYHALLAPLLSEHYFAGFFVWRVYADPEDVSQEPEFGFSPRGKVAELVLRDAFEAHWATDDAPAVGWGKRARVPGIFP